MKTTSAIWSALAAAAVLVPAAARAGDTATNRLSLSARFGFNISGQFKGIGSGLALTPTRSLPGGDQYNYDDGYVGGVDVPAVSQDAEITHGVGFDPGAVDASYESRGSLGMVNMRERAELVNGVLRLESVPGSGTRVQVLIPLTDQAAERMRRVM